MKKMVGIFLAMSVVLSLFAGFAVSAADKVVEYVTNGGFEDENFATTGWTSNGSLVQNTTKFHGDSASLELTHATKYAYAYHVLEELQPGRKYTFTGWFNIDAGEKLKATATVVFETDGDGVFDAKKDESIDFSATAAALDEWTELTGAFEVPEGASGVRLQLLNNGGNTTVYWDDVSVTWVKHPELLTVEQTKGTGGWTGNGSTVKYENGIVELAPIETYTSKTYAYVESVLLEGEMYRLAFDFNSNAQYNSAGNALTSLRPVVTFYHYYADGAGETKSMKVQYSDMIIYTPIGGSGTNYTGVELPIMTNMNDWMEYVMYFGVPELEGYTYAKTRVEIGQYGKYVDDSKDATKLATYWLRNVSLKEDYNTVVFKDVDTGTIFTDDNKPTVGTKVKAVVHIEGAGKTADKKKVAVVGAEYGVTGTSVKTLSTLLIEEADNYIIPALSSGDKTPSDILIVPANDIEFDFTVGAAGNMLSVLFWDSFTGMKPIEMESISARAADAA